MNGELTSLSEHKMNIKSPQVIDKCKKIVAALKWRKDVVQSLVEDKLSKG